MRRHERQAAKSKRVRYFLKVLWRVVCGGGRGLVIGSITAMYPKKMRLFPLLDGGQKT